MTIQQPKLLSGSFLPRSEQSLVDQRLEALYRVPLAVHIGRVICHVEVIAKLLGLAQ